MGKRRPTFGTLVSLSSTTIYPTVQAKYWKQL